MDKLDIILITDDMSLRETTLDALRGHNWTHVLTPNEAQERTAQAQFDLVILDIRIALDNVDGAMQMLTGRGLDPPVIVLAPEDRMELAAQVVKAGAFDYALLPIIPDRLYITINKAAEAQALLNQVLLLKPRVAGQEDHPQPLALIKEIARSNSSALIRGENGSSMDIVAKALHFNGLRHDGPFVEVACASLPPHTLEAELFGYVKGAVAGGMVHKSGQAELSSGGALFLNNIETLGLNAQGRLMKGLLEGVINPMGSDSDVDWDSRLIAGAEADLGEFVRARAFREDLLEQISTVKITIPPLRERKEDIPNLIIYYLEKFRRMYRRGPIIFSETILKRLADYSWPGNLRELEKTIERYVVAGVMPSTDSPPSVDEVMGLDQTQKVFKGPPVRTTPLRKAARTAERELIIETLKECFGNKKMAARALKISYKTLFNKLHEYNIVTRTNFE